MNIYYVTRQQLFCISKLDSTNTDLSLFFSASKSNYVYITSKDGILVGYIDHSLYKIYKSRNSTPIKTFKYILIEDQYLTKDVDFIFQKNSSVNAVPVVDKNFRIKGAYIRSIAEELVSNEHVMNTIALSVLPCFVVELHNWIKKRNISKLYLIASDDTFGVLKSCLHSAAKIIRGIPKIKDIGENVLVIDALYSKSYRSNLSRTVNASILSLEELMAYVVLPIAIDYVKKREGEILMIEGPLKERITDSQNKWPHLFEQISLSDAISNYTILSKFCNNDIDIIRWSQNSNDGILAGDEVCTNGIHLLMSQKLRQNDKTSSPCIYLFGPCFSYGACVPPGYRIADILNEELPGFYVQNNGVKNGRSILNDALYILSTNIQPGDIVIDINDFTPDFSNIISNSCSIHDFNEYLNDKMNNRCYFLDNTFHANCEVTRLAAYFILKLIASKTKVMIKRYKVNFFEESRKISLIDSKRILGQSLLSSYIDYLNNHKVEIKKKKIGSVILTANPITKGHEHLINFAKSQCDILYVFIVEEDLFEFSTSERIDLVRSIIKDRNVIVLSTGRVMTAKYTFPDYYNKNHTRSDVEINPMSDLHFYIFGTIVAPILGITKRFVGEEIPGSVTDYYNKKLKSILPSYGIELEVIPRLSNNCGNVISASKVRELIKENDFSSLSNYISQNVLEYIQKTRTECELSVGRWSTTLKIGNKMHKRYKYYVPDAAKREATASQAAYAAGVKTPSYLKTIVDNNHITSIFEFIDFSPITNDIISSNNIVLDQILSLFSQIQNIPWNPSDKYWSKSLLPEYANALSYVSIDTSSYVKFLNNLNPCVFIHGDFSCDNIAWNNGFVYVFDFQHGCLGPLGWDKAYLAATFRFSNCPVKLSDTEEEMAEIIAAIRYGRAIRKNSNISERKALLESWRKRKH